MGVNFVKNFSASIEIIIRFLSFNLLMWCITLIDLQILKNPCIPGMKPTWSLCMIFLICCWILFARILLRIFASMFTTVIGLQFPFFVASSSVFDIREMVASQNEFGSLPSSEIFWKSLHRLGVSSSLNFWQNSPVKPSGPGLFFCCCKMFDYSLDFCICDGSVKIIYFLLVQFWKVILF